jgi:hypothetical protein
MRRGGHRGGLGVKAALYHPDDNSGVFGSVRACPPCSHGGRLRSGRPSAIPQPRSFVIERGYNAVVCGVEGSEADAVIVLDEGDLRTRREAVP